MNNKPNNYAFIDAQNLYVGMLLLGWKLDYKRFRQYLRDKYNISKAFLFMGYTESNEELYKELRSCGFIIIFRKAIFYDDNGETKSKGNVDTELTLYAAAREFNQYDKALIISSDGDFACLVEYLLEHNKLLAIMAHKYNSLSGLLKTREIKPYLRFINQLQSKLQKRVIPVRTKHYRGSYSVGNT